MSRVCAAANKARPRDAACTARSSASPGTGHWTIPPATNSSIPTSAAHKAPCQRRSTKSSSKAARAHSQKTAGPPEDNASRNRLHHGQDRGKVGAEQIAEAAALTMSAAPRRATVLSRRSRSATQASSKDNPTAAPRRPRSIDKKPLLPTIGTTPYSAHDLVANRLALQRIMHSAATGRRRFLRRRSRPGSGSRRPVSAGSRRHAP